MVYSGRTTKDVTKPKIVNWKNNKNCEVIVFFKKDNIEYSIHRGLKPNYLKVFKDNVEFNQLAHNGDFQEEIEQNILGIDYDTFINLIYYHSSRSQSIFDVSKSQKRNFIEKLFGLEFYSELVKKCNEKMLSINQNLTDVLKEIEISENLIDTLKKQNSSLNDMLTVNNAMDLNEKEQLEEELANIEKELKIKEKRTKEFNEKLEEFEQNLSTSSREEIEINSKIMMLNTQLADLTDKNHNFNIKKFEKLANEIKSLEENTKKFDIKLLEDEIYTNTTILNNLSEEKIKLITEKSKQEGILSEIPVIDKNFDTCPICEHKVNSDKLKEKYETKRKNIEKSIFELNNSIEKFNNDSKVLNSKIKDCKDSIEEYNITVSVLDKKKLEYKEQKKLKTETEKHNKTIEQLQSTLEDCNYEKENIQKEIEKQKRNIKTINDKLKSLNDISEEKKEFIKSKIDNFNKLYEERINKQNSVKILINENKDKITENETIILSNTKQKEKYKTLLDYFAFIKKICSDENVKQYAISSIIPYLNAKANDYLSEAGFDFYLKLDNWLNVEIKGAGIKDAGYGNLSSGQQKTTNLAMIFAFLDICKIQINSLPDILLFDEILDGAIDALTISQIVNIIKKKQKEYNFKIFIVSHRQEIEDLQFDNQYQITFEKGFSQINKIK